MGKVKTETSTRAAKSSGSGTKGARRKSSNQLLATFLSPTLYKPIQGWHARLWTGLILGTILLVGVWRLYSEMDGMSLTGPLAGQEIYVRNAFCGLLAAGFAWSAFRLVHYPPFADFLIATQTEMKKVSWISRDDLRRATIVVIVTVLILSLFLFGIDQIWILLLQWIQVIQTPG